MKESLSITRIFINLSRLGVAVACLVAVSVWAVDPPEVAGEKASEAFDLPDFVQASEGQAVALPADAPATDAELSEVIPNKGEYTNAMTVGDIVVSPRQKLLKQSLADIRMEEVPVRDALRYLAEAAGINYVLPDLETENVTVNMRLPPFRAMEVLAGNFGLGIYEEDGLWFIRKKDKAQYFAKIYKLHNIHLGESTSGSGKKSEDSTTSSSTTTSTSSTTGASTTGGSTTAAAGSTSASGVGGQVVITTLQEILGINVAFGGTIGDNGDTQTSAGATPEAKKEGSSSSNDKSEYTYVSYSADANTLFIIATATQHQWVDQYLKAIDNPTNNIAIEAMFLESSLTPTENLGFNWEGASSLTMSTYGKMKDGSTAKDASSLPGGTLGNPKFPWGALIQTNNFTASLSAFQKQTDSQVARYPSVVTQNGREVKIETTQNVPLSATQRLVQNNITTGDAATVGIQDLGVQKVGTTITITPRQINDKLVQLTIAINISTATDKTDANTNRVTTNETSYTGTVNVPEGYTLAIGGLERVQDSLSTNQVPGLGKIPLFGFLFKSTGKDNSRTSIFLFITPTVLKTEDARPNSFMKPTEGLSRDWIDKAEERHRAWRRESVDPEVEKTIKDTSKP